MDIKIDKTSKKILKILNKSSVPVTKEDLKSVLRNKDIDQTLSFLESNSFIKDTKFTTGNTKNGECVSIGLGHYTLDINGKVFIENCKLDTFFKWYPHIVSTAAVIISLIALLRNCAY